MEELFNMNADFRLHFSNYEEPEDNYVCSFQSLFCLEWPPQTIRMTKRTVYFGETTLSSKLLCRISLPGALMIIPADEELQDEDFFLTDDLPPNTWAWFHRPGEIVPSLISVHVSGCDVEIYTYATPEKLYGFKVQLKERSKE